MEKDFFTCFSGKAQLYASSWPCFGPQYIETIKKYIDPKTTKIAYDVACGTGLNTNIIADFFEKVYAIEPNADMLKECKNYLRRNKNITYLQSSAESLPLLNDKADVIFVSQAFTLLDHALVKETFKKNLNAEGIIVVAWNNKLPCKLFDDVQIIAHKFCPLFENKNYIFEYKQDSLNSFYKSPPDFYKYNNDVPSKIDKKTFISRCISTSYALSINDNKFNDFYLELENVFDKYNVNGLIDYPLETTIYIGKV